jgi:hypothetical protein
MAPAHIAAIRAKALTQMEYDHGAWKNEGGGIGVSSVSHDEIVRPGRIFEMTPFVSRCTLCLKSAPKFMAFLSEFAIHSERTIPLASQTC